jgi:hypothetical protein
MPRRRGAVRPRGNQQGPGHRQVLHSAEGTPRHWGAVHSQGNRQEGRLQSVEGTPSQREVVRTPGSREGGPGHREGAGSRARTLFYLLRCHARCRVRCVNRRGCPACHTQQVGA